MAHARTQHPNATLTPLGRRKMIACVIDRGWTIEATAERFQVDAKTVRKWRDRFLTEGPSGLLDRSSRPHLSPNATPDECRRRIIELRQQRRWGAAHIGFEVDRAGSTVQRIEPPRDLAGSTRVIAPPKIRWSAISVTGPAS